VTYAIGFLSVASGTPGDEDQAWLERQKALVEEKAQLVINTCQSQLITREMRLDHLKFLETLQTRDPLLFQLLSPPNTEERKVQLSQNLAVIEQRCRNCAEEIASLRRVLQIIHNVENGEITAITARECILRSWQDFNNVLRRHGYRP
jgi:hypothetical protein